jgi:hypothetical protein
MNHAITVADVLWPVLIIGGVLGAGALLLGLIWLLNPFRSGH